MDYSCITDCSSWYDCIKNMKTHFYTNQMRKLLILLQFSACNSVYCSIPYNCNSTSQKTCSKSLFDRNTDNENVIVWFIGTTVRLGVWDVLYDFHALCHSSKHCVFVVKPGLSNNTYEHHIWKYRWWKQRNNGHNLEQCRKAKRIAWRVWVGCLLFHQY